MEVFYGKEKNSNAPNNIGICLGNFDGIHYGHAAIIGTLNKLCMEMSIPSMIYTFRNHPDLLLKKHRKTPLIITEQQKINILSTKGIDFLYLEEFNDKYAKIEPEDFIKDILVGKFHIKLAVVGHDYTFGANGLGSSEDLKDFGVQYGFDVEIVPSVTIENIRLSSTLLRELVKKGDMESFLKYTGRYYSIPGTVEVGRKVGRTLGFPTANIIPGEGYALPGKGVYATQTTIADKIYNSVTNIGNNPTFENINRVTIETHILDFCGFLYGDPIEVFFHKKLRDEKKFSSIYELKEQINYDVDFCKRYFKV